MKKCVIHVGLHKTATTFLQKEIWPNFNNYTYISRPYTQHNHAFNKLQYADDSLYSKNELLAELTKIKADNILLSDECLSGKPLFFSYINRSLIAQRLKDVFPDATIVIFLRDQKEILRSHYSEYIKMPYGTKKLEELFWKSKGSFSYEEQLKNTQSDDLKSLYYNTNDFFIHLDCFLYTNLLDLYSSLFEHVEVFLFEEFLHHKQAVLARLENILGEGIRLENVRSNNKTNVSLSTMEMEVRRLRNKAKQTSHNPLFIKLFSKLSQSFFPVRAEASVKKIIDTIVGDHYVSDNQKLKKKYTKLNFSAYPDHYL